MPVCLRSDSMLKRQGKYHLDIPCLHTIAASESCVHPIVFVDGTQSKSVFSVPSQLISR